MATVGRNLNQASTSNPRPESRMSVPMTLTGALSRWKARRGPHNGEFCGRYAGVSEPTRMRKVPSMPVRVGTTRHAARRSTPTSRILSLTHHLRSARTSLWRRRRDGQPIPSKESVGRSRPRGRDPDEINSFWRRRDQALVPGESVEGALLDADAAVEAGAVVDGEGIEDLVRTQPRARWKVAHGLGMGGEVDAPCGTLHDADDAARTQRPIEGDGGVARRSLSSAFRRSCRRAFRDVRHRCLLYTSDAADEEDSV